ncbi:MAG: hypothetical protein KF718_09450 [Polyangiaceae bacterium]|nr:hypothetical protein [Polyangiaceae bacterium]
MSVTLVLWFIGSADARVSAEPHLQSWSRARWTRLVDAETMVLAPGSLAADATAIETSLESSRLALGALDTDRAERELDAVDRSLRADANLPQAAWLMAERWVLGAELRHRLGAPRAEVEALLGRAAALAGPRATSYGDPLAEYEARLPVAKGSLEFTNLRATDAVYVDGVRQTRRSPLTVGLHHLRVLRRGRAVLARWIEVDEDGLTLELTTDPPCSREDLSGARVVGDRVLPATSTVCPRWVAARPAPGGVLVALCAMNQCSSAHRWRDSDGAVYADPAQPRSATPFPTWVAIGTGVGAAVLTSIVLLQTGAFSGPEPGQRRFVYTGPGAR